MLIRRQFHAHSPTQFGDHWVGNLVKHKRSLTPTAEHASPIKHAEVPRDIGLRQAGQLHHVLNGPLLCADRLNDAEASWLGEQGKVLGRAIKDETEFILVLGQAIDDATRFVASLGG